MKHRTYLFTVLLGLFAVIASGCAAEVTSPGGEDDEATVTRRSSDAADEGDGTSVREDELRGVMQTPERRSARDRASGHPQPWNPPPMPSPRPEN